MIGHLLSYNLKEKGVPVVMINVSEMLNWTGDVLSFAQPGMLKSGTSAHLVIEE